MKKTVTIHTKLPVKIKPPTGIIATLRALAARVRMGRIYSSALHTRVKTSDGRLYEFDSQGVIHRISPVKPWASKAERRQVLRDRRQDRLLAAANLTASHAA